MAVRNSRKQAPTQTPSARPSRNRKWVILAIACLLVCALPFVWRMQSPPEPTRPSRPVQPNPRNLVLDARQAMERKDYEATKRIAQQCLDLQTKANSTVNARTFNEAAMLGAEAATQLEKFEQGVEFCRRVNQDGSPEALASLNIQAELLLRLGRLSEAEKQFVNYLRANPSDFRSRRRLVFLLGISGRLHEVVPQLLYLLQQDDIQYESLLIIGNLDRLVDFGELIRGYQSATSPDQLVQLGMARIVLSRKDAKAATGVLEQLVQADPELIEAQARLGEAYAEQDDWEQVRGWLQRLPVSAEVHPAIWITRARWAQHDEQKTVAARCYWEAIRRDPNDRVALYQLGQLLHELHRSEDALPLLERHRLLGDYVRTLDRLYGQAPKLPMVKQAAEQAAQLGRMWEAFGWYRLLESLAEKDKSSPFAAANPLAQSVKSERMRIGQLLADNPRGAQGFTVPEYLNTSMPSNAAAILSSPSTRFANRLVMLNQHPLLKLDLSSYPLGDNSASLADQPRRPVQPEAAVSVADSPGDSIAFEEIAKVAGVDFQYFCSPNTKSEGKYIYEFGGGGIAACDIDNDGWPDLVFTQGCQWPPPAKDDVASGKTVSDHLDTFYRNLGNGSFQNITAHIGSGDIGFGQGITAGDYDSDGFVDLYIANVGCNQLLHNNGDGTFTDVTKASGVLSDRWTSSCVMVDINRDGHPDIYDVNYLKGEKIYERICAWEGGHKRICGPATFEAEQDQLWLSKGDGSFVDASSEAGILLPEGNGLGVVAGNLDGTGRISLFIANDQTANYFLVPKPGVEDFVPQLEDRALLTGLAYDADGARQACMGVAAGDADGDGLVDLFVTNYYAESNTLYKQIEPGQYDDVTRRSGLREPSMAMLGFGTQFIDIELDGRLDLVLTNGHLDDFKFRNQPYEMRPQLFHNLGQNQFKELEPNKAGPFFAGAYRGRALARLDFNRDGRHDVAIGHLDTPSVLLANRRTQNIGKYLSVHLVGIASPRDPIGATVRVTVGQQTFTGQLTAGDGYQSTNERTLLFGLGPCERIDKLSIDWPSGQKQEFESLSPNSRLLVVEGREVVRLEN